MKTAVSEHIAKHGLMGLMMKDLGRAEFEFIETGSEYPRNVIHAVGCHGGYTWDIFGRFLGGGEVNTDYDLMVDPYWTPPSFTVGDDNLAFEVDDAITRLFEALNSLQRCYRSSLSSYHHTRRANAS